MGVKAEAEKEMGGRKSLKSSGQGVGGWMVVGLKCTESPEASSVKSVR